jgi:predicted nucleotidyltransferase
MQHQQQEVALVTEDAMPTLLEWFLIKIYLDKMLTKKEIFQTIIDHKDEIKSFGVTEIGLFGSYVRNEQTEASDIDILVDIIKEKKTLKNYIDFCDLLENLFKNNKIDIVSKKGLSEFIGPHILKEVDYVKI